jgi:hypothetical protein
MFSGMRWMRVLAEVAVAGELSVLGRDQDAQRTILVHGATQLAQLLLDPTRLAQLRRKLGFEALDLLGVGLAVLGEVRQTGFQLSGLERAFAQLTTDGAQERHQPFGVLDVIVCG